MSQMQLMLIYVNILRSFEETVGFFYAKQKKEISENDFIAEYMINKRSIHVFMNSSEKFMRCLLNQSFLCCLVIFVDALDIQQ